jgi:hypothetical protein
MTRAPSNNLDHLSLKFNQLNKFSGWADSLLSLTLCTPQSLAAIKSTYMNLTNDFTIIWKKYDPFTK